MTGYEKLKAAVVSECKEDGPDCFNPQGCDKENATRGKKKCLHRHCDKFAWVIGRAKHYAEKTGLEWQGILDAWENWRSDWYHNHYDESRYPEIHDAKPIRIFETMDDLAMAISKRGFRCPACGGISTNPYECDCDKSNIHQEDGDVCQWKVWGLLGDLGKGVYVFCKDVGRGERIFMPVKWEEEEHELETV